MDKAKDDVNVKLFAGQRLREVKIGFENYTGNHEFSFFNLNLLRCRHLLNNLFLFFC